MRAGRALGNAGRAEPRMRPRRGPALAAAAAAVMLAAAAADASADLAAAVRDGDLAAVRAVLETRAGAVDVDVRGRHGMTALLWAVQANDLPLARLLLEAGADPELGNRYGITPMWLAATNRSAALIELLLEHGAKADAALPHGETALMAAARAGDTESIGVLLAAGADPNRSESALGETALMWAAAENHGDAVRALAAGGATLDAQSHVLDLPPMDWAQVGMVSTVLPVGGWTALMMAAREDARAAAQALAEVGAGLDVRDPDGPTALQVAIMNGHYDLAAWLLEAGADPNVADRTGMNALYGAVEMVNLGREIGRPAVPSTSRLAALDLVRLTLAHGADPNAALTAPVIARHHGFADRSLGGGATPLMRAARNYDVASMRMLLKAGADAAAVQADGSNALYSWAAAPPPRGGGAPSPAANEALTLLLEAGVDVDSAGPNGETPLHRAARSGNAAAVTLLAERGADLDVRDAAGRTPLDVVSQPGRAKNEAIAELLRQLAESR